MSLCHLKGTISLTSLGMNGAELVLLVVLGVSCSA